MNKIWDIISCNDGWHVWDHLGCEITVGKGLRNWMKSVKLAKYLNVNQVNAKFCDIEDWIKKSGVNIGR